MLLLKPQMSAPTMGMPNMLKLSTPVVQMIGSFTKEVPVVSTYYKPEMEYFMASQSERTSPVQCPPYLPCPGKVERDMMNGRSFGRTDLRAAFVTIVSVKPYMLWRL